MVNKQGQTRLSNYYDWLTIDERSTLEAEIIRKCLSRTEAQCSFMEYRGMKVVYRRYASLFFIVGVEADEEVRLKDVGRRTRARALHTRAPRAPPPLPPFRRAPSPLSPSPLSCGARARAAGARRFAPRF
jgi:hypothetical protein